MILVYFLCNQLNCRYWNTNTNTNRFCCSKWTQQAPHTQAATSTQNLLRLGKVVAVSGSKFSSELTARVLLILSRRLESRRAVTVSLTSYLTWHPLRAPSKEVCIQSSTFYISPHFQTPPPWGWKSGAERWPRLNSAVIFVTLQLFQLYL